MTKEDFAQEIFDWFHKQQEDYTNRDYPDVYSAYGTPKEIWIDGMFNLESLAKVLLDQLDLRSE